MVGYSKYVASVIQPERTTCNLFWYPVGPIKLALFPITLNGPPKSRQGYFLLRILIDSLHLNSTLFPAITQKVTRNDEFGWFIVTVFNSDLHILHDRLSRIPFLYSLISIAILYSPSFEERSTQNYQWFCLKWFYYQDQVWWDQENL